MNRRILFAAIFLLVSIGLSAENITLDMAKKMAVDFFKSQTAASSLHVTRLDMVYDGRGDIVTASAHSPALYVFDNPDGKGFVIVAGDDIACPILGYSFENDFPKKDIPPHVKEWLKGMEQRINYLRDKGVSVKANVSPSSSDIGSVVKKLNTARWNQDHPYNLNLPTISGSRAVTGCTITATAIVMYYHKYPVRGEGVIPAYTTDSYGINIPERSLGHDYKWNLMQERYVGNYSSEQAEAVAVLMADLGHMLNADYGLSTAASTSNIPLQLSTYMGYYKGALELNRYEYDDREWYDILQNEIDENRPVIYSGYSSGGGHAFVLDGYTTSDYFSVNWGWGGYYNGYFILDALNPEGSGIGGSEDGYNSMQAAIVNLKPEKGGEYIQKLSLSEKGMSINDDKKFTTTEVNFNAGTVKNTGSVTFYGAYRWCLVDKNGNLKQVIKTAEIGNFVVGRMIPGGRNVIFYPNEPFKRGDRIRFYYKSENDLDWILVKGNSECVWDLVLVEDADIRKCTKLRYDKDNDELRVTTRVDVSVGIFSSAETDYSSLCQTEGKITTISTSSLPSDTYTIRLSDGKETVNFKVKLN